MRAPRALLALLLAGLALAAAPGWRVLDQEASYPEGPLVIATGTLVAEMGRDQIAHFDAEGRKRPFYASPGCGPTSIAPFAGGYVVLCHRRGGLDFIRADGVAAGRMDGLGNPNDSFADGRGGVYFTSPGPFSKASAPQGLILHIDAEGVARVVADGLHYPNGVYVDVAERALYVSEHLARRVLRFPLQEDGGLGPLAVFAEIDAVAPPAATPAYPEAGPDGLERAPNGDLVVALYGEERLLQLRRDGRLRRVIPAPGRFVTNIAFERGGAAIVTAPRNNAAPPFPGVVARLPAAAFATP